MSGTAIPLPVRMPYQPRCSDSAGSCPPTAGRYPVRTLGLLLLAAVLVASVEGGALLSNFVSPGAPTVSGAVGALPQIAPAPERAGGPVGPASEASGSPLAELGRAFSSPASAAPEGAIRSSGPVRGASTGAPQDVGAHAPGSASPLQTGSFTVDGVAGSTSIDTGQTMTYVATISGFSCPTYGCYFQFQDDGSGGTLFDSGNVCYMTSNTETWTDSSLTALGTYVVGDPPPGGYNTDLYDEEDCGEFYGYFDQPTVSVTINAALGANVPTCQGGSTCTIDAGQTVTLTANPTGGTPAYSFQWYSAAGCSSSPISGATSSTYSTGTAGTYYYHVGDSSTGTPAASACSAGGATVVVNPALVANAPTCLGTSVCTIDHGQSVTLTASPSGGTTPYSYQWYSAAGCASGSITGATGSTYVASAAGTYSYEIGDASVGTPTASACSATGVTVAVNPALVANAPTCLGASSCTIDAGQRALNITSNPSGGTAPYAYQWYSASGCSSGAVAGATASLYAPIASGTYYYHLGDASQGTPAASACSSTGATYVVNPALSAGTVSSPVTIDVGASTTLNAGAPTGGTSSYTYQWLSGSSDTCSSDAAIAGATTTSYLASPGSSTYYCVEYGDSSQGSPAARVYSNVVMVTVDPDPQVQSFSEKGLAGYPDQIDLGMFLNATVTMVPGTGTAPFAYSYTGLPEGCTASTTAFLSCVPSAAGVGPFSIQVTILDAGMGHAWAWLNGSVNPDPAILSFTATPRNVSDPGFLTFEVTATGGTGVLAYNFSGGPPGCSSLHGRFANCTTSGPGTFVVHATVTDAWGRQSNLSVVVHVSSPTVFYVVGSYWWLWLILIAVVVGAVVALLLWRRRSRQLPPEEAGFLAIGGAGVPVEGMDVSETAPSPAGVTAPPEGPEFTSDGLPANGPPAEPPPGPPAMTSDGYPVEGALPEPPQDPAMGYPSSNLPPADPLAPIPAPRSIPPPDPDSVPTAPQVAEVPREPPSGPLPTSWVPVPLAPPSSAPASPPVPEPPQGGMSPEELDLAQAPPPPKDHPLSAPDPEGRPPIGRCVLCGNTMGQDGHCTVCGWSPSF